LEREELVADLKQVASDKDLATIQWLGYHLRTLLHRNDCLGMAASIESRFPFLDSQLVRLAVNMPYDCKVRFSPTVLQKKHYFLRDKWVLRKVADRYLPPDLAHRPKFGFPFSAFRRMQISPKFFEDSFVSQIFGLGRRKTQYLIEHVDRSLKLKLLHLEIWARVCLNNAPTQRVTETLKQQVTIASQ